MATEETYTLADSAIAQIAKLIQVAILTGTDIVDHLRTLRMVKTDLGLVLEPAYQENFENNLVRMMEEVTDWEETESEPDEECLIS